MSKEAVYTQKVKVINKSGNQLPAYETAGASGMDLRADLQEPVDLNPLERTLVPTGIFIALPKNFEAQIRPRSGLAIKYGITLVNAPGTIDEDYRGEIKVILINLSNEKRIIQPGDRIAQIVFSKYEKVTLEEVEELNSTARSDGGFGHTGL